MRFIKLTETRGDGESNARVTWLSPEAIEQITAYPSSGKTVLVMRNGRTVHINETPEVIFKTLGLSEEHRETFCGAPAGEGLVCMKAPVNWGRCDEHQPT